MNNCQLVADLLPSYCDGLTSTESSRLVEDHIAACPQCARLLAKMQANQESEEKEKQKEEFRRNLSIYDLSYRLRVAWIAFACAILVIGFFVLQHFSEDLALISERISIQQTQVITATVPLYNKEGEERYGKLIRSLGKDGRLVLALLEQNALGFWYVSETVLANLDSGYDPVFFYWIEYGENSFRGDWELYTIFHVVYLGNNAIKKIEFPKDALPEEATVQVEQGGSTYLIHAAYRSGSDGTAGWNLVEFMIENDFISTKPQED